jgi:nucleoside phosphorylase
MSIEGTQVPALFTGLDFEAGIARKAVADSKQTGPIIFSVGMGAVKATEMVKQALEQGAAGIISFGVCGAIAKDLKSGFVILPENILSDNNAIPVDKNWHARVQVLLERQFDLSFGNLVTVSQTVATTKDKKALAEKTGAVAVDMESAVLAELAIVHNIPFIAIRVVHDTAQMEIPKAFTDILDTVEGNGQISKWKLLKGLLFNWPGAKVLKQLSSANDDAMANLGAIARLALPDFRLTK